MSDVQVSPTKSTSHWTTTQVYVLAVICFLLGFPAGYLFHSAPSAAAPAAVSASASTQAPDGMNAGQVTPEQLRHMADKTAEPILADLKSKPNDPELLAKAGNVYYDAQQYDQAVRYYGDALKGDPKNSNVRTDMATAFYYLGDADRAITELNTSLQYNPNHAQTLLNLGLIKWQAKMDINGAVAAWQKLIDTNPNFEGAEKVKQMIAQAKQHANIKAGAKAKKPI